ncbi:fructose PTS transporter subunit IIA [Clostridium sp. ZS2-4]|uniref:fructose PTS transporter subunit IIA n=1 Tax=Clostridium sp. ZS2-4 TaxID=2987703 RepID=UPI00227B32D7|nr:fructose PTS transporter subunit IIA [Clostridium sp. ZS2-4]MCY6354445.1 fructose PTS transporter subunit IIA [Clostridium sp. ZS2-4]
MIEITLNNVSFVTEKVSKEEVLNNFSNMAMENNCIEDTKFFLEGLFERENEFSTGVGSKVAIPHCKSETVKKASVFIQRFSNGVEWEALDGQPVELAICLAVPENEAGTTHLKLLSNIARSLINKDFVNKLLSLDKKEDLVNEMNGIING